MNALSIRVNELVAAYVATEAKQHDPATPDAEADALGDRALAIMDEIYGIKNDSGNVDVAAAVILMEIMLDHCYAELREIEWGYVDRQRLRLLALLVGGTTGEIRKHTAAILATIGVAVADAEPDPLLIFLTDWKAAVETFEAQDWPMPDEASSALCEATCAPYDRAAAEGNLPSATTAAGAAAAIRKVMASSDIEGQPQDFHLLTAALAFLKGSAA